MEGDEPVDALRMGLGAQMLRTANGESNSKVVDVLGYQSLQSVTSIGANCRKANRAESRQDFAQIPNPQSAISNPQGGVAAQLWCCVPRIQAPHRLNLCNICEICGHFLAEVRPLGGVGGNHRLAQTDMDRNKKSVKIGVICGWNLMANAWLVPTDQGAEEQRSWGAGEQGSRGERMDSPPPLCPSAHLPDAAGEHRAPGDGDPRDEHGCGLRSKANCDRGIGDTGRQGQDRASSGIMGWTGGGTHCKGPGLIGGEVI